MDASLYGHLLRRGPTSNVNIHSTHVLPRRVEVVAAYMRVWMHPYMATLLRREPTSNVNIHTKFGTTILYKSPRAGQPAFPKKNLDILA